MADNYLENKMAEHMARRNGGAARRTTGQRTGVLQLSFAPRRVLVAGPRRDLATECAEAFRAAGCRTAMLTDAGSPAVEGVRCYGGTAAEAIAALMHDWHEIDVLVLAGDDAEAEEALRTARAAIPEPLRAARAATIALGCAGGAHALRVDGTDAAAIARMAMLLAQSLPERAEIVV